LETPTLVCDYVNWNGQVWPQQGEGSSNVYPETNTAKTDYRAYDPCDFKLRTLCSRIKLSLEWFQRYGATDVEKIEENLLYVWSSNRKRFGAFLLLEV